MRIFISHSSRDRELAALLVDLLRSSLNLPAEAIRCTSVDGHRLMGGEETDRALRKEIRDCEAFIGLISVTSIESAYVLFELGARWGAERHLLPLLAPTADSAVLRGPLSGLNALSCSRAADIHQAVQEIATILGNSAEKPAAYQRHVDQILAWGANRRSDTEEGKRPFRHKVAIAEGIPADGCPDEQAIIAEHCEGQWPTDYAMREFCIEEQERALAQLRAGRPEDIPEDVFRSIRQASAAQWPSDFTMRLFTEQEQLASYRKLQRRNPG